MYVKFRHGFHKLGHLLLITLLAVLVTFATTATSAEPPKQPTLASLDRSNQRILIVAPHPDDEALGAAGLARQFLLAGSEVWVVLATNGDANQGSARSWFNTRYLSARQWVEYGEERQRETITALARLGITEERVFFLSYPDSGIDDLWGPNWSNAWRSPFTQVAASPYSRSFTPGAAYTGEAAWRDFAAVMAQIQPTLVLIPHPADTHQDHWSAGAFATTALEAWRAADQAWAKKAVAYEYLVHWPKWPWPAGVDTSVGLSLPMGLENTNTWEPLEVDEASRSLKSRAITDYRTQAPTDSSLSYLLSFSRAQELFAVPSAICVPTASAQRPAVISTPSPAARKPGTPVTIAFSRSDPDELQIEFALSSRPPTGSNWLCSFYGIEPTSAAIGNLSITNVRIWPGQTPQVQVTGLYESSAHGSQLATRVQAELQTAAPNGTSRLVLRMPLAAPISNTFLFSVSTYNGNQLRDKTPCHVVYALPAPVVCGPYAHWRPGTMQRRDEK